ncbi:MAG: SAM-dependent chlorinase/fluorinase [Vicinamibacterales bacterium]
MARPVIALLTDFGLSDHYVAAMKGGMLGICPDATLLDITHDIPPQDILSGALELESVGPYLPPSTIVVGVVDPGVGSLRRAVAFDTRDGLRCVGPDNGLFSLLAEVSGVGTAVEITNPAYMRVPLSKTFEGRDRFAPAAAWLARGVELLALGPMATDRRPRCSRTYTHDQRHEACSEPTASATC